MSKERKSKNKEKIPNNSRKLRDVPLQKLKRVYEGDTSKASDGNTHQ